MYCAALDVFQFYPLCHHRPVPQHSCSKQWTMKLAIQRPSVLPVSVTWILWSRETVEKVWQYRCTCTCNLYLTRLERIGCKFLGNTLARDGRRKNRSSFISLMSTLRSVARNNKLKSRLTGQQWDVKTRFFRYPNIPSDLSAIRLSNSCQTYTYSKSGCFPSINFKPLPCACDTAQVC